MKYGDTMNLNLKQSYIVHLVLFSLVSSSMSCSHAIVSTRSRNLTEEIIVENKGNQISESNILFVLELRQTRKEIEFGNLDNFLSSKESAELSRALQQELITKRQKISETISDAKNASGDSIIFVKINEREPYSDENIMLYLMGDDCYFLFFSLGEIDEIYAISHKVMRDDFETILCEHPNFNSSTLAVLKTELEEKNIKLKHAELSEKEIEKLKILTAAGILENELRNSGVQFKANEPLLRSGLFRKTYSPKLTIAFRDKSILEQIRNSDEVRVVKSFNYLVERRVIALEKKTQ